MEVIAKWHENTFELDVWFHVLNHDDGLVAMLHKNWGNNSKWSQNI